MLKNIQLMIATLFVADDECEASPNYVPYFVGLLLFICCGIKLYAGLPNAMDIQFADEAAYLRFGLELFDKINYNWGPMYAVWYKFLSCFTQDTIQLYYLNFALVSVLLVLLMYVFLLRLKVHPYLALFITFSVLVSNLNVSVWPRISHFCVALSLFTLIIVSFLHNKIYKCYVFTIACLMCAYARPEFYLTFALMMLVTLVCIYFNRQQFVKKEWILFLFFILIIAVLHFIFRFPSNDFFGYNRGVAAFYQHYAWNYKMRTNGTFDAWLIWEDLAKSKFGDCNSMLCVILNEPMEFLRNTLFNVRTFLLQLLKVFSFVVPFELFRWKKIQFLLMAISVLSFFGLLIWKPTRTHFLKSLGTFKFYLLLIVCFVFPTLISCIVVFPRDHYLFLQMMLYIVLFVSIISFFFQYFTYRNGMFAVLCCLLFLATPNVKSYQFMKVNTDTDYLCNIELIHHIEKNYASKQHTIFTNLPFVHGMLPTNFKEVNTIFDKKKHRPFQHYLDSANIDMVIVLPSLLRDPHVSSDSTWNYFMQHYEQYGFKKDVFSKCEMYLLQKNALETH